MKVFDSIIFFNELDLLEMRLNILNDVVDYFVVTESPFTVSGNEKPLYYAENKDRFGKFNDKIIHHVTEEIQMILVTCWRRQSFMQHTKRMIQTEHH